MKCARLPMLAVLLPLALAAQVGVKLHTPQPWQMKVEDLWHVDVVNKTGKRLEDVWFDGVVSEAEAGRVYWAQTRPFDVKPGKATYRLRDVQIVKQGHKPGYEAFVARTGVVPDGRYSYRIILKPLGVGDSVTVTVRRSQPPRLLQPPAGADVRDPHPLFSWAKPMPPASGFTFRLRLVEMLKGQTELDAMLQNRPWFEKRKTAHNTLRLPVSASALKPGGWYAWRVEAMSGDKVVATSEVRGFRFLPTDSAGHDVEVDYIRVHRDVVEPWDTVTLPYIDGSYEVTFSARCNEPGCGIRSYFWRVAEASDHDANIGVGTGDSFSVPPLGHPRQYVLFLTAYCEAGYSVTRPVNLNIGP